MKEIFKKALAGILALLVLTAVTGCNNAKTGTSSDKLTYWVELNSNAATTVSNYGDTPFAKELQKRIGVEIDYQHPPQGQAAEKFNIMIAMDNLPDIIEYHWADYPGGPGKAISAGLIRDISKELDKAPNFKKYLDEHPEIAKWVKTDNGEIFGFPFIRGDESLQVSAGLMLRKDWLDELGLDVPETIDEWEKVLTAFKEKKGASAPLIIQPYQFGWGAFCGAFGVMQGTYIDDGKIVCGSVEPGFKEFLTTMNRWYQMGLLDNNIAAVSSKTVDSNILNGLSGATAGSIGSGIGRWMQSAKEPDFELVAAPYPTLKKGDYPEYGQAQSPVAYGFVAISKSCKNVDLAYKLLDYGYSDEGHMLFNFGIEGESYTMQDGEPIYTDLITKNPDGLSMTAAMSLYMQSYDTGAFVQDKRYMDQYATLPQQKQAWEIWGKTNAREHIIPFLYMDESEANEIAKLQTSVNTYQSEMLLKFIMGIEPIENYDSYVQEMNNRGLSKILDAQQRAYERYLKRK